VPTFKLSDEFSFSTDIEAGPGALSRYFKSLPDYLALAINLNALRTTTWDDPEVATTNNQLSFKTPVDIGGQAAVLKVGVGVNGTLSVFVPQTDKDPLFKPDLFGDNIPVRLNERYVCASLQTSVTTTVGAPVDKLQFGFTGESGVNLSYCQRFSLADVTPPVLESIKQTLANFAIPADVDDFAAMPEGSVASVDSTGSLKFSGTVNLLTFVNPLASVKMPIGSDLKVTAGGSIDVGAGYEYSGDYQIRVQRLAGSIFHLGFYRQREKDFSVTASASAGISTSLDSNPLFQAMLASISSDPQVDQNELAAAGLPQGTINAIQKALKSAIDRTLSLGIGMELHAIDENDAMFLYEVDLDALTPDSKSVLESALQGDLSGLVARDHTPGAGIRALKSLISSGKTLKHALKVNLLGIYNSISISKLVRDGSAAWDATTGEYVLTDSVNASHLGIDSVNFGANSDKLRNVLAESLLMTAAYRAGACVSGQPALQARHSHFALSDKTSHDDMLHDLQIGAGLGFADAAAAASSLPAQTQQFGRTTVLAEACYDDDAFGALFFDGARQRDESEYDRAGRNALTYLTHPGDGLEYRLRAAQNDALWAKMREIGNVQSSDFRHLFPDLSPQAVSNIGVDYINIVWWTEAMLKTGEKLRAMRQYLSQPGTGRTDPEFLKRKGDLANQLATLAGRTRQDFGGPWGLLAMNLVAPRPGRRFLLSSPTTSLMCETSPPSPTTGLKKKAAS
jgi:hypothetical protein